jgi:hypothetical protein
VRRAAVALVAIAALAGCNDDAAPTGIHSPEGVMIRDWLMAVEHYDFSHAADFFAPGAIIDQSGPPYRLRDRRAARLFNSTLPCRAELIALSDEGAKVLATFRLEPGLGGSCSGRARVRYTIVDGRFTEWRQLPSGGGDPTA